MRIRRKKWAGPELKAAAFCIDDPGSLRGRWRDCFPRPGRPLMAELGCGKGAFISRAARLYPEYNWIGIDKISSMLGVAKRAAEREFGPAAVDNLRLAAWDIERIGGMFAPEDRLDGLHIYFCNPWPKERHKKHRLTHPRQLALYRGFLVPGASLRFKTDDGGLFEDTLRYLRESGFTVVFQTWDLHAENIPDNIETEHEREFAARGIPIKYLIARMEDV